MTDTPRTDAAFRSYTMTSLKAEFQKIERELASMTAERDRYHDALIARHGGEPISLLSELDEAREELASVTSEIRLARKKWLGSTYDHLALADAIEAALDARGRAPVDPALEVVRAELAQAKDEVKRLNTILLLGNIPVALEEVAELFEAGVQLYRRRE